MSGVQQKKEKIHYLVILGLVFILVALIYGYKTVHELRRRPFPVPRQVNVDLLQAWMNIPYISRTYGVPEEVLLQSLNISTNNSRSLTVNKIAQLKGKPVPEVIEEVKTIIQNFQETHRTPSQPQSSP